MSLQGKIDAAGFVLAGGMSTRMGRNKALLEFEGETLVARGVRRLGEVFPYVAIAGGVPELSSFAHLIPDVQAGLGPLSGIVAALEESPYQWNAFVPVDVPFVPADVWRKLYLKGEWSAVLARVGGRVQPLCGLYARSCVDVLARELKAGRGKVLSALEASGPVVLVDFAEEPWFKNVNTPEEFANLYSEPVGG